jgi:rhodanese-related sulfurtransferase
MLDILKKLFGSAIDFKQLKDNGAVIIDVRTPGEFSAGHIKDAINIPLDNLRLKINYIKKKQNLVITCCASGMRSGSATSLLKQAGIEAYNGGGWVSLNNKLN